MQKNILLTRPFMILPLLSCSMVLSMDQQMQPTYAAMVKKGIQLPNPIQLQDQEDDEEKFARDLLELFPHFTKEKEETHWQYPMTQLEIENSYIDIAVAKKRVNEQPGFKELLNAIKQLKTKRPPIALPTAKEITVTCKMTSSIKPIKETREYAEENIECIEEDLYMSVIPQNQEYTLGWLESFRNLAGNYIKLVIPRLQENNPDVITAKNFYRLFNNAITQAINSDDVQSFTTLIELSHDKPIRMSQQVALNAFAFYRTKLEKQTETSQETINKINDYAMWVYNNKAENFKSVMTQYAQEFQQDVIKEIADSNKKIALQANAVADMQTTMAKLAALHKDIRDKATKISNIKAINNQNILAKEQEPVEKRIRSIMARANATPTFNILKIDNK